MRSLLSYAQARVEEEGKGIGPRHRLLPLEAIALSQKEGRR